MGGCVSSSKEPEYESVLDASDISECKRPTLTDVNSSQRRCSNNFINSIENIPETELSNDIKLAIIELFKQYNVTKRLFNRSSKYDMKDLLTKNIPNMTECAFDTVYYSLSHCDQKHKQKPTLQIIKCGKLRIKKGTIFNLISDIRNHIIFEYDSIILEEDSILTTREWNSTTKRGGRLYIKAKHDIILHKNAKIDVSKLGHKQIEIESAEDSEWNEPYLFAMHLGRGNNGLCGGGAVKISCDNLIMYEKSEIRANGDCDQNGGSIYIDTNAMFMQNASKIEAANIRRGRNNIYDDINDGFGKITLNISNFFFIQQYIGLNVINKKQSKKIPNDVLLLIVKFWGFLCQHNIQSVKPEPYVLFK